MLTFEAAIAEAKAQGSSLAVLLGNGFSIDYDPAVFRYESLAEDAVLAGLSIAKTDLFETLGSSDFEVVVEKLDAAAALQSLYHGDASLTARFTADARAVRNGLVEVIARRHPAAASRLSDAEVQHARTFLANFGCIFTLSYDLLLYWVVNRKSVLPRRVPKRDGFEPTNRELPKLIWNPRPSLGVQQIFHLHGALHYFPERVRVGGRDRSRVLKVTATRARVVDVLRRRLDAGQYPLVVAEGRSAEKKAHIDRSPYLRTCLRRFERLEGALFVHGASLSRNDDHIWELLEVSQSRVAALYVGLYDRDGEAAGQVVSRAELIRQRRSENGGVPLQLRFYDAGSAGVWRDGGADREAGTQSS